MRPANFRDVGETLELWLSPSPIPVGRLLRGGRIDSFTGVADVGHPRTVLNLRRGPDPDHLGLEIVQVPASNDVENYDTTQRRVLDWLGRALRVLGDPATVWPVYVHCTSGRDRTGVVVAAALHLVGVPRDVIVEEYCLSDGADRPAIRSAIEGISKAGSRLEVDVEALRRALCDRIEPR